MYQACLKTKKEEKHSVCHNIQVKLHKTDPWFAETHCHVSSSQVKYSELRLSQFVSVCVSFVTFLTNIYLDDWVYINYSMLFMHYAMDGFSLALKFAKLAFSKKTETKDRRPLKNSR